MGPNMFQTGPLVGSGGMNNIYELLNMPGTVLKIEHNQIEMPEELVDQFCRELGINPDHEILEQLANWSRSEIIDANDALRELLLRKQYRPRNSPVYAWPVREGIGGSLAKQAVERCLPPKERRVLAATGMYFVKTPQDKYVTLLTFDKYPQGTVSLSDFMPSSKLLTRAEQQQENREYGAWTIYQYGILLDNVASFPSHFVHRDLKPGNVIVSPDQHYYIADFGIGIHDGTAQELKPERERALMGSPPFMAPETLTSNIVITPEADRYNLMMGLITYLSKLGGVQYFSDLPLARWKNPSDILTTAYELYYDRVQDKSPGKTQTIESELILEEMITILRTGYGFDYSTAQDIAIHLSMLVKVDPSERPNVTLTKNVLRHIGGLMNT